MNSYSIIIPSYNGAAYIRNAIESAINQNRPADEIIVSDDNSSDDTISICLEYKNRIKIYQNTNGPSGFVNGWNNAISKAQSDYICILHQDDIIDQKFLFEADRILDSNPDIFHFFCICNYINAEGNIINYSYPCTKEILRYSGLEYVKVYQQQGTPHIHRCPGVITHRSIFEKCRYNPSAGHIADDDFFFRVGMYTDVIGLMTPLASYRLHNSSETGKLEDFQLVKRLINDYIYQLKQWKNKNFLDKEAWDYFVKNAYKYSKRYIGYGLKKINIKMAIYGLYSFLRIWKILF